MDNEESIYPYRKLQQGRVNAPPAEKLCFSDFPKEKTVFSPDGECILLCRIPGGSLPRPY